MGYQEHRKENRFYDFPMVTPSQIDSYLVIALGNSSYYPFHESSTRDEFHYRYENAAGLSEFLEQILTEMHATPHNESPANPDRIEAVS